MVVTGGVDHNLLEVLGFLSGFVSLPLAFFLSLIFSSFLFFLSFYFPLILLHPFNISWLRTHMFLAQKPTLTL